MTYTPNWSDPRVVVRAQQAMCFVKKYLNDTTSKWLSSRWINHKDNFGSHELSKFLRDKLLICSDESYNKFTGKTKHYLLNRSGFDELNEFLCNTHNNTYSVAQVSERIQAELHSGEFVYNDSSSRLYHPLQNFKREDKRVLLAADGYLYNYDIQCCAPTLIMQYAQQLGMDLYPFAIRQYITNRKQIRNDIALAAELTDQQVKRIINGLFQGAHISRYNKSLVYQELSGDIAKIEFLKQIEFIQQLQGEIKTCWEYIRPQLSKRTIPTPTGTRLLPITGKQKTALYRDLERVVLNSVRDYLNQTDNQNFAEHDGWTSKQEVDIAALVQYIKTQTGYQIEIEQEFFVNT
jgi:hypothetical protein